MLQPKKIDTIISLQQALFGLQEQPNIIIGNNQM